MSGNISKVINGGICDVFNIFRKGIIISLESYSVNKFFMAQSGRIFFNRYQVIEDFTAFAVENHVQ